MTSPRGTSSRAPDAIWITLASAMAAAVLELAVIGSRRFINDHMVFTGWQTVWTTPASYALFMLPGGIILAALARLLPRWFGARVVVFLPVFVAAFSVGYLFVPKIHVVAAALLATGVAAQVSAAAVRRMTAWLDGARRLVWAGGAAFALAAIAVHGGRWARERQALSSLPTVDNGEVPSVLLIVLDAVRAQNLSLYGYSVPTTPRLAAFAARGLTFEQAYSTAPWTLTSHATMFTGRYPDALQANWRTPLEPEPATLAEVLARRGYATGGFVGNVAYTSRETGLARGFAHYEDYRVSWGELLEASSLSRNLVNNHHLRKRINNFDVPGRKSAADIARDFLRWQAGLKGRPFFAFLNLYDAHEPYLPPAPFDTLEGHGWRDLTMIQLQNNSHGRMADRHFKDMMPADERRAHAAAYDGAIASIDDRLGRLFEELERRGRLTRTLVIVTADHGEQLGEHGLYSHANSLFLPLLHVPLVMVLPERLPAARIKLPVTLRDLAATIVSIVSPADSGALPGHPMLSPGGALLAGESPLMSHILPPPQQEPRYITAHGEMYSLIAGNWHYIRGPRGVESLFDIVHDSDEIESLAGRPEGAAALSRMRMALDSVAHHP